MKRNDDIYNGIIYVPKCTADNTHSDTLVHHHFCLDFVKDDSPFDILKLLDRLFHILLLWYLIVLWPYVIVLDLGCMRGIKSLNSKAIHFLINKLLLYKGDMSFKTLNKTLVHLQTISVSASWDCVYWVWQVSDRDLFLTEITFTKSDVLVRNLICLWCDIRAWWGYNRCGMHKKATKTGNLC